MLRLRNMLTLPSSSTAAWRSPTRVKTRILVKSPKVATYDLKPEMSAYEVCDKLCDAITSAKSMM